MGALMGYPIELIRRATIGPRHRRPAATTGTISPAHNAVAANTTALFTGFISLIPLRASPARSFRWLSPPAWGRWLISLTAT